MYLYIFNTFCNNLMIEQGFSLYKISKSSSYTGQ